MRAAIPMIDLHSHVLPETLPAMDVPGFPRFEAASAAATDPAGGRKNITIDGRFFRAVDRSAYDIDYRIDCYEKAGVRVQVVCTVPVLFSYHLPAAAAHPFTSFLNDHIAELQTRHPDRVIALGTLPLQDATASIAEARRLKEDLGVAGIQIGSNVNNRNLDDPELFRVFEACQDLGLAVLVHPWNMMGSEHMPDYWLPWLVGMPAELSRAICSMIFGGVFERLPELRVCFAHGGGAFPFTVGRIEHGFMMRPDLVATRNPVNPRDYLGRFWVDSVTHDPQALRYLLEVMGEDRVALGTDYPFPLGEQKPGAVIRALDPPDDLAEKLVWRNTMDFLKLNPADFGFQNQ